MTAEQRKMPSGDAICDWWLGDPRIKCCMSDCCWRCGKPGIVQRCHIQSRHEGGSDEASNLHLLCITCHRDSEYLDGDAYWLWFNKGSGNPVDWVLNNLDLLLLQGVIDVDTYNVLKHQHVVLT